MSDYDSDGRHMPSPTARMRDRYTPPKQYGQARRHRKNMLQVWLSDEEQRQMQAIATEAGLNMSDLLRSWIARDYVTTEDAQTGGQSIDSRQLCIFRDRD